MTTTLAPGTIDWNTIILAFIGFMGTVATGVITYFIGQMKNNTAATATSVEKIHIAVNSERTAALEEIRALRDEILRISKLKAALEEEQKGTKKAAEVAAVIVATDAAKQQGRSEGIKDAKEGKA